MVIGHWRCWGDRRCVLRRAHHGVRYRAYVASHAGRATLAGNYFLGYSQTPSAHQNSDHQERYRQSRTDHQGSQEDLQGQDQYGARLAEVYDTTRAGLPVRILHQSGSGNDISL